MKKGVILFLVIFLVGISLINFTNAVTVYTMDTRYPTSTSVSLSNFLGTGSEYFNGTLYVMIKDKSGGDEKYASSCGDAYVVLGVKDPSGKVVSARSFVAHSISTSSYRGVYLYGLTNLPVDGSRLSIGVSCYGYISPSENSHTYYTYFHSYTGTLFNSCTPTNCAADTCEGSTCVDCGVTKQGTKVCQAACVPNCDLAADVCTDLTIRDSCDTADCPGQKECSDVQTLFKIYQANNSHVSSWNTTSYPISINYNDVFGFPYAGTDFHNCTGSNTLFWMSAENNSHFSNSSANGYNYPVCYGDLRCSVASGSCAAGYSPVVRLYNYSNTHVSGLDDVNYNSLLCCKPSSAGSLVWRDLNGELITNAEVEDDLIIDFTENIGASITYSILNESAAEVYSSTSSEGFGYWKADREGSYSFKITQNGVDLGSSSENLVVSGSGDSAPTAAQITFPSNWYRIKIGTLLPLNQISMDSDDIINIFWWLGNGSYSYAENYSYFKKSYFDSTLGDQNVTYTASGVYLIELKVQEKDRTLMLANQTFVAVFKEGVNVIPVISSPVRGNSIQSDIVLFNASETYVANCSSCSGSCTGTRSNGFYTDDGLLNCTYLHAPGSGYESDLGNYILNFKWTLDNGRVISGDWSKDNYWKIIEFIYRFELSGEHLARLEVSYAPK